MTSCDVSPITSNGAPELSKESAENIPKSVPPVSRHPRYIDMVIEAVKNVKGRRGTSLQSIKKYLADTFRVVIQKARTTHFIHKAVIAAVENGTLVSVSGRGVSGSFKLGAETKSKARKPIRSTTDCSAENPTVAKSDGNSAPQKVSKSNESASSRQKVKKTENAEVLSKKTLSESKTSKSALKTAEHNSAAPTRKLKADLRFENQVVDAVKHLKSNSGSSLQAIKKYLSDTHQVNVVEYSRFITKAINTNVQKGTLVRISGRGARGVFKVGETAENLALTAGTSHEAASYFNAVSVKSEDILNKTFRTEKKKPSIE